MKRKLILIFIIVFSLTLFGCSFYQKPDDTKIIVSSDYYTLNYDEQVHLPILIDDIALRYEAEDNNVVKIEGNVVTGIKKGSTIIYGYNEKNELIKEYVIKVNDNLTSITIDGPSYLTIGSEATFTATTLPLDLNQEVYWESSDPDILSINDYGIAMGKAEGLVTVTALSKNYSDYIATYLVLVTKKTSTDGGINNEETKGEITIDTSSLNTLFSPLIDNTISFTVGVNNYKKVLGQDVLSAIGTGIIYKRQVVLKTGLIVEEDENIDFESVKSYKYYVVTNKHIVVDGDSFTIYNSEINYEVKANLIQYDSKIDLAVLSFESGVYFNTAKWADSSSLKRGEFCIAVGHPFGYEYNNSATIGIISHHERYITDDTDGDGQSDWDAQYIQHDAAINEGNSGGPLINLKGEVIGVNTLKLSSELVENMGFSIPSNTALELINFLEEGKVPQRPLLGIEAIEVKTIIVSESLLYDYPVPEGITYGIYVVTVSSGGVASAAGMRPGDILLSINGVELFYTYMLRAELGKIIIGSGETVELVVLRNNERVTLNARF